MSDKKIRHGHKSKNGKSFIILPIIFCLITYLVLYLAFVPSFSPVISAVGMFFSDNEKDYSTEYDNIFVPVSENSTVPTVTKKDSNGQEKTYVKNDSVQYPNYGNLFGELIINDCNVDANLFFGDNDVALRNGVAFMPEVLSPVTAEQSLLQVITTLISTVLKTHQSVRRLKSRQATVITSMKSPTRLSKKRLTEPHMTFRRIMKIS